MMNIRQGVKFVECSLCSESLRFVDSRESLSQQWSKFRAKLRPSRDSAHFEDLKGFGGPVAARG